MSCAFYPIASAVSFSFAALALAGVSTPAAARRPGAGQGAGGPRRPSGGTMPFAPTSRRRRTCYTAVLDERLASGGPASALQLLDRLAALDPDVRRDGHMYAHRIGISALKSPSEVGRVFATCTPAHQSGCYHGVIQSYFMAVGARRRRSHDGKRRGAVRRPSRNAQGPALPVHPRPRPRPRHPARPRSAGGARRLRPAQPERSNGRCATPGRSWRASSTPPTPIMSPLPGEGGGCQGRERRGGGPFRPRTA